MISKVNTKVIEKAYSALFDEWNNYCFTEITISERELFLSRTKVLLVSKHESLFIPSDERHYIFFTVEGLLAQTTLQEEGDKRPLLAIAPPRHALMTTYHLHNLSGATREIIALRPSVVIQIPYRFALEYYEGLENKNFRTLINVLKNRKNKQISQLREITFYEDIFVRYSLFCIYFPHFLAILQHQEVADLLNFSLSSAKRASKYLVTGLKR